MTGYFSGGGAIACNPKHSAVTRKSGKLVLPPLLSPVIIVIWRVSFNRSLEIHATTLRFQLRAEVMIKSPSAAHPHTAHT